MPKKSAKKAGPPPSTRPMVSIPDPDDPSGKKIKMLAPQPVETKGYSGSFRKIDEPEGSEPYKLRTVDADDEEALTNFGHTHFAVNQEHFWSGTEKQFRDQFEKT